MAKTKKTETIPLSESQWALLRVWFVGSAVILTYLIFTAFFRPEFQGHWTQIIGWALPNLVPTLSLIATVVGATAINPVAEETFVRKRFHQLVTWVSIGYLGLNALPFIVEGAVEYDILQVTAISDLWLGPIQGIVAGFTGVLLFVKPKGQTKKDEGGAGGPKSAEE